MKFSILCLPIALQVMLTVALYTRQPPVTVSLTPAQRDAERRELLQERDTINKRLQTLETPNEFVPRGIGEYSTTLPLVAFPATGASTPALFRSTRLNSPVDHNNSVNRPTHTQTTSSSGS